MKIGLSDKVRDFSIAVAAPLYISSTFLVDALSCAQNLEYDKAILFGFGSLFFGGVGGACSHSYWLACRDGTYDRGEEDNGLVRLNGRES